MRNIHSQTSCIVFILTKFVNISHVQYKFKPMNKLLSHLFFQFVQLDTLKNSAENICSFSPSEYHYIINYYIYIFT